MKCVAILVVAHLIWAISGEIPKDGVGLVFGGFGGSVSSEVIEYDTSCLGNEAIPFIPGSPGGNIEGWSCEYVDEKVFLCGGSNINQVSDCYDLTIGEGFWNYNGEMNNAREYVASVVFNDELVMLGGYNDHDGWLDSVEKKDANSSNWQLMRDWTLPRQLFNHCAVSMSDTEIVVFGGNEYGNDYLNLISVLDTTTGTWTDLDLKLPAGIASMGCLATEIDGIEGALITGGCINDCMPRIGHGMTYIDGVPAVVGGYHDDALKSVEFYENGSWRLVTDMLEYSAYDMIMPSYLPMDQVTCRENDSFRANQH